MFRTVPMMRLQAVVLARDERTVLKSLGQLGAVHLTRTQFESDTTSLTPVSHVGEMAMYDRIRSRVQELRKSLEVPPLSKKQIEISSSHSEREGVALAASLLEGATQAPLIEDNLYSLEQKSKDLSERRQGLIQRQKELAGISEQVSRYHGFEIPLSGLDQFSFLHFITGSLPAQNLENLEKEIGDNVALLPLVQQKGQQSVFAITTRKGWPDLEMVLQRVGFQHETLPVAEGTTVEKLSEEAKGEQRRLAAELEQVNNELRTVAAGSALTLDEIERFADIEYRLLDASQNFLRTEATALIAGWVPADGVTILEEHIGKITGGHYIIHTSLPEISALEQVPVLLKHSRLLRPFEVLVSTYGLPNYRELEPTLFVALSYIVMFGIMFGDAGHGAVLATCGLFALFTGRS